VPIIDVQRRDASTGTRYAVVFSTTQTVLPSGSREDDVVRAFRVTPCHLAGAEGQQPLDLGRLVRRIEIRGGEIEVVTLVALRVRRDRGDRELHAGHSRGTRMAQSSPDGRSGQY